MHRFTPATANRTLPLVRRIAHDLVGLQSDLRERQARIERLLADEKHSTSRAHAEELADMRSSLSEDQRHMQVLQRELAGLGASIHSHSQGVIDFPAQIGSRSVRLCWRLGESHVGHWHEVDAPLAERRPIAGESFTQPLSTADA